jgi:hypothetical protein
MGGGGGVGRPDTNGMEYEGVTRRGKGTEGSGLAADVCLFVFRIGRVIVVLLYLAPTSFFSPCK